MKRLQEHEQKTIPVIEKYQKLHGLTRIDGMGPFDEIFQRLSAVVEDGFKRIG